jgi:hypothetical protein
MFILAGLGNPGKQYDLPKQINTLLALKGEGLGVREILCS